QLEVLAEGKLELAIDDVVGDAGGRLQFDAAGGAAHVLAEPGEARKERGVGGRGRDGEEQEGRNPVWHGLPQANVIVAIHGGHVGEDDAIANFESLQHFDGTHRYAPYLDPDAF